jgi:hypothetical protein
MVATAEVSKNLSFFQLSICSINDSGKKKDLLTTGLFENKRIKIQYRVSCKFESMGEWVI